MNAMWSVEGEFFHSKCRGPNCFCKTLIKNYIKNIAFPTVAQTVEYRQRKHGEIFNSPEKRHMKFNFIKLKGSMGMLFYDLTLLRIHPFFLITLFSGKHVSYFQTAVDVCATLGPSSKSIIECRIWTFVCIMHTFLIVCNEIQCKINK